MSKAKHTPGPWEVMPGDRAPRICVDGDKEWPIVVTISGHSDEAIKANENLIAAAPEMFEALKEARAMLNTVAQCASHECEDCRGYAVKHRDACDVALAKAKGGGA